MFSLNIIKTFIKYKKIKTIFTTKILQKKSNIFSKHYTNLNQILIKL